MATTLVSTGIQFPDATIQTTAAAAGGGYVMRTYTSPATWTKPNGLRAVKVTVIGGGGGSGGARGGPTGPESQPGTPVAAGIGGGGGSSIAYISAPSIPGPASVTIGAGGTAGPAPGGEGGVTSGGAGGTSSFGSYLSSTGGSGSSGGTPGTGGSGSGGDVNVSGGRAQFAGRSASGQDTLLSISNQYGGQGAGIAGVLYGGGATGAFSAGSIQFSPSTPYAGAVGAAGIVIVEEFY
jgi:hypothetical protein